jgi:hypothetical protein
MAISDCPDRQRSVLIARISWSKSQILGGRRVPTTMLSKRFVKKFGHQLMYGLPYWATLLVWNRVKNVNMRHI